MVAKRGKMEENMGTGRVELPFLTDDEVIGLAARKRIAAAFGRVAALEGNVSPPGPERTVHAQLRANPGVN